MQNNAEYKEEDYAEDTNMDEYLDDDYLVQLHNELKKAKIQRKQAEQDTNLLDNRIKCLRNEEVKANKRNEELHKTTQKKIVSIQQQEEDLRKKLEFRERKQRELEQKREQNKQLKENNRMAILLKQEENRKKLEDDLNNLKVLKKANMEMKNYQKIEDLQNKKTIREKTSNNESYGPEENYVLYYIRTQGKKVLNKFRNLFSEEDQNNYKDVFIK